MSKVNDTNKNIMLFFIGGITQNEIFIIEKLAKQNGKKLLIITTNIINSNSFYNILKQS